MIAEGRLHNSMPTHAFEPELDQPTPRRVRRDDVAMLWLFRVVSVVPVLLGVTFFVSAANETLVVLGYGVFGSALDGRVVARPEMEGRRTARFVEYAYSVDGQEYARRERVGDRVYDSSTAGQPIRLEVVPWAPEAARVAPVADSTGFLAVIVYWGLAAIVNAAMVAGLWHLFYVPWRQRRLVRHGLPTGGLVRGIQSGEDRSGKWYQVEYEYAPPGDGPARVLTGSMTMTGPVAEALKVGDVVTVLYDPRRPRRSLLYRFGDYRAVGPQG